MYMVTIIQIATSLITTGSSLGDIPCLPALPVHVQTLLCDLWRVIPESRQEIIAPYLMDASPKGMAVIINNVEFTYLERRNGANRDAG